MKKKKDFNDKQARKKFQNGEKRSGQSNPDYNIDRIIREANEPIDTSGWYFNEV